VTRHSIATVRLCTAGVEETEAAGAALAAILAPGTVVGLVGPLGAGKTCFVRGMASRLGVDPALVASPTFVYLVDYPGRDLVLYHADLYRLVDIPTEAAEAAYEGIGLAAAFAAGGISVVEWWSGYRGALPPSLVRVEFAVENAEHRQLTVVFDGSHASEQAASFVSEAAAEGLKTSGRAESMARKYRIVQKYGGTSVGSPERIRAVARRVKEARDKGWDVAVVVSAMAGETNRLLALAHEIAPDPNRREVDVLIATGEQVATALVTLALHTIDVPAVSFQGHQVKVMTDSTHGHARIKFIDDSRVQRAFDRGQVVVIAGFQGIDEEHNITTLGRGGSDTTAVAIAAALHELGAGHVPVRLGQDRNERPALRSPAQTTRAEAVPDHVAERRRGGRARGRAEARETRRQGGDGVSFGRHRPRIIGTRRSAPALLQPVADSRRRTYHPEVGRAGADRSSSACRAGGVTCSQQSPAP